MIRNGGAWSSTNSGTRWAASTSTQSPNEHLDWDVEAVYRYFSGPPNNWDPETIDHNILEKYSPEGTSATLFDPDSIMLYMFPPQLFRDHKATHNNTESFGYGQSVHPTDVPEVIFLFIFF